MISFFCSAANHENNKALVFSPQLQRVLFNAQITTCQASCLRLWWIYLDAHGYIIDLSDETSSDLCARYFQFALRAAKRDESLVEFAASNFSELAAMHATSTGTLSWTPKLCKWFVNTFALFMQQQQRGDDDDGGVESPMDGVVGHMLQFAKSDPVNLSIVVKNCTTKAAHVVCCCHFFHYVYF